MERTRASCSLGIFSVFPARNSYLFHHTINRLLTELVRSRLLDTSLCSFCVFVLEFVSDRQKGTHIHARKKHKKERGQYPDILTSRLVRNAYVLNEYHAFTMMRDR